MIYLIISNIINVIVIEYLLRRVKKNKKLIIDLSKTVQKLVEKDIIR